MSATISIDHPQGRLTRARLVAAGVVVALVAGGAAASVWLVDDNAASEPNRAPTAVSHEQSAKEARPWLRHSDPAASRYASNAPGYDDTFVVNGRR